MVSVKQSKRMCVYMDERHNVPREEQQQGSIDVTLKGNILPQLVTSWNIKDL